LLVSAFTWSAITGTIATRNRVRATRKSRITVRTAYDRRIPRCSKNSTAGLSPAARNSETTTSISVEPMAWMFRASHSATSAPRPPTKPT